MWANALKCIEQLAKPQYASFVLCITAATTSVASVVLLHNKNCQNCQSGGNIHRIHRSCRELPSLPLSTPPTAFDIIAKFHFRRGLTGNVHVPPSSTSLCPSLSIRASLSHSPSFAVFDNFHVSIFHYMQQENPLLLLVGAAAKLFMHNAGKVGVALVKGAEVGGTLFNAHSQTRTEPIPCALWFSNVIYATASCSLWSII